MKPKKFYDSLMPIMLLIEVLFGFGMLVLAIFMGVLPFFVTLCKFYSQHSVNFNQKK